MFANPIVFIVGAGASSEYGLPLGAKLKEEIANSARYRMADGAKRFDDVDFWKLIRSRFPNDVETFEQAGFDLAKIIGKMPTIDEALHYYSSRKEVVELGKIAIAKHILSAERSSALYNKDNQWADVGKAQGTWLPRFMSMAISGARKEEVADAFSNISIVNFNYDRSLEYYLYWALQSEADLTEEEARNVLTRMTVLRPYGSIGGLEWQGTENIPYGGRGVDCDLVAVSKKIRTFTEQPDDSLSKQIELMIASSRVIVFLGFGFHQQNMSLLKVDTSAAKYVFTTVYNIHHENHELIEDIIGSTLRSSAAVHLHSGRAHDLLQTNEMSILAASAG